MRVVLVHSALGDSRLWRRQVEALSPAYEVVAPDLPGFGETPLPTEPFSFVDAVAAHLPAALVGNSFGGAVALRTALAYPERVSKLVLVGSALPAWEFTEEMRSYWAEEGAAVEAGDLDLATQVNLDFWVKPEHHDEVRPQQRRAFELQTAHEEPELVWPAGRAAVGLPCRRSSSSARTTRPTSARSRSTSARASRTRSS